MMVMGEEGNDLRGMFRTMLTTTREREGTGLVANTVRL
jgi:hypothetical protein